MFQTLVALATGPTAAAVAVVRLSGADALDVARRLVPGLDPWEPRRLALRRVVSPRTGAVLDRGLVAVMPGPGSYTGEDTVELQIHGGALNARRVLEAALEAGARMAEPGELTRRAFLNGRLDLAQAEAVGDIVAARGRAALDAAQAQLGGSLSRAVHAARDRVVTALAQVEVGIDFSTEDVPALDLEALAAGLDAVRGDLEALAATFDQGRALRDGLHVAILGRPNAGKSSLFNAILRDSRSIVTDIPGTTRDLVEEVAQVRGVPVVLVDTAGLRDTDDPVEREGVARARTRAARADVALCVLDGSRPPAPEDALAHEAAAGRPTVVALTKCDLPRAAGWDAEGAAGALPVSAVTGEGVDGLADALLAAGGLVELGASDAAIVTNARHRAALVRGADALGGAATAARGALPYEIVAGELQLALEALGDVVGATTAEDVLDRIFSTFCIGK